MSTCRSTKGSTKTDLLEHSEAKVQLYSGYLERYLAVLSKSSFVSKIHVFDLFCGEGKYENDKQGSPLAAIDTMQRVFAHTSANPPIVEVLFNDNGVSEIEPNLTKIQRLKRFVAEKEIPKNVTINFSEKDFDEVLVEALEADRRLSGVKSLFFIDPYGYTDIQPNLIREILSRKSTELILFLPVSFMYRFVDCATKGESPGHKPLKLFLDQLFSGTDVCFTSTENFIVALKNKFKEFLNPLQIFNTTYSLKAANGNMYCLFLFTTHVLGFQKMLETKWDLDEQNGKGFEIGNRQRGLFTDVLFSPYVEKVRKFLKESESDKTNSDLFLFGLENEYLPSHTKKVLDHLSKNGTPIRKYKADGTSVKGYCINYKNYGQKAESTVYIGFEKS